MKRISKAKRSLTLRLAILLAGLCGFGPTARAADFTVVASFPTYTINGLSNPTLMLQRGRTYTFSVSSSGHPFFIKSVQGSGTGNPFNTGVTGNGAQSGTLTFAVPANAPATLFYNCQIHGSMTGTINIVDPPPPPVVRILDLAVGTNLALKFTGTNTLTYFPEFNTNLATTNWFALSVQTNFALNGTNEVICGRPPGSSVFIRVRGQ